MLANESDLGETPLKLMDHRLGDKSPVTALKIEN